MTNNDLTFRKLHDKKTPLILPNIWDAGSARLFEDLGAKAIATTSAGVSWALGYPDGDTLPIRLMCTAPEKLDHFSNKIIPSDLRNFKRLSPTLGS